MPGEARTSFRFTIRDLLWLTVMVALGLGWWLHHRAWAEKYSDTVHDSKIWQARTEAMQVKVDILVERLTEQAATNPFAHAPGVPSE